MRTAALLALVLSMPAAAQDKNKKPGNPPQVDSKAVNSAIDKGVAWLKRQGTLPGDNGSRTNELILLTYAVAGVPDTDPSFQSHLKIILEVRCRTTYSVALGAMAFEEILNRRKCDPVLRQKLSQWMVEAAQFLVDNQGANGQWGYGEETTYVSIKGGTPTLVGKASAPSSDRETTTQMDPKKGRNRVLVKKRRDGLPNDNSNTQYAILGMRACYDAGIDFEKSVYQRSLGFLHDCLIPDIEETAGSCYTKGCCARGNGGLTLGAAGSRAMLLYMNDGPKDKSWKSDKDIQKLISWIVKFWTVEQNPPGRSHFSARGALWHYYYLYALERVGMLCGIEKIGVHDWYHEGAQIILKEQREDGSWIGKSEFPTLNNDTCFALLFLKRATRKLEPVPVASKDERSVKDVPNER